jgi:hypothetical protein
MDRLAGGRHASPTSALNCPRVVQNSDGLLAQLFGLSVDVVTLRTSTSMGPMLASYNSKSHTVPFFE